MDGERLDGRGRSSLWRFLLLIFVVALVPSYAAAESPCASCHAEQVAHYDGGPHATGGAAFCGACHGDPARHLESGDPADIVGGNAIEQWSSEKQANACLGCHGSEFPAFRRSVHAGEKLCWSCHASEALHGGGAAEKLPPAERHATFAQCTSCHKDVAAQTRMLYRHPVQNGQMDCTDCHDIHGRSAVDGNRGRNTTAGAQLCENCHQEQSGPFLFAHEAVDQGCQTCHNAHGSPHRAMLVSRGNGVCLGCHVQTNFPSVGKVSHDFRLTGGGRCWDCHSDVHGSNTTSDFNPRGRR